MNPANICIPVLLCLISALSMTAQTQPNKSDEFRARFLEQIPKNSLSSTLGDSMMLRILIQNGKLKRGIEVGVALGYGAIHMGIAFERNQGTLTSIEIDPRRAEAARTNIASVGLEKTVNVIVGDALAVLPKLEGQYDFIYLDALKSDYLKYLKAVEPKLRKGAVVVADNVIVSARAMADFLEYMRTSPDYESVTIRASDEKGDGMLVAYRLK
ncbi:MAG TPA: class I SAM-dependent methyltransferase [Bryobacteraceae bacterium]|nr:class I SAM-dependent methyltransferase [Bryobacteraceae bacterium]